VALQLRPLSYALGAEISGVDIRKPLGGETAREIMVAFYQHGLLLFRNMPLTQQEHIAFTRQLGEMEDQRGPIKHRTQKTPEILSNNSPDPAALVWHTDRSFVLKPALSTILRGVSMPPVGGDTMWANLYLAYDTLSDGMKKLIDKLDGIHPGHKSRLDYSTPETLEQTMKANPPVAQPLVRMHPETGRKALFIGAKITQIAGLTTAESKPILDYLLRHATRPQFCYRHVWNQTGDVLMWDNCATLHVAVGDYDRSLNRHTEKTNLVGKPSGYVYTGPVDVSHY
jgi:taurine dioxygenase